MTDGCTALAKIIGNRYFLAKNRDLVFEDFNDAVVFDDDVFFVTGINMSNSSECGASFGINRWGLSVCNSAVLVTDEQSDDLLMEQVLRESKTIEDAFSKVRTELKSGTRCHWCNFVLATPAGVGVIEIGEGVAVLEQDYNMVVRSNHHLLLPTSEIIRKASAAERNAAGPLDASLSRRQLASKLLSDATTKTDISQILSTHSTSKGFDSICRHHSDNSMDNPYLGETLYSYISEVVTLGIGRFEFRISVAKGNPCSELYMEYEIDFDIPREKKDLLVQSIL